jgi:sensor domain CHASE-containing protein
METVAAAGFSQLMELGAITAVLVLVIIGLCWFITRLLADAKEERRLNREALIHSTEVISELKELIRSALQNR